MNANMKSSEQCRIAPSKGNQIIGMIRINITYKEKEFIVHLYKAIARPSLEYCIREAISQKGLEKHKGEQLNSFQNLEISATKCGLTAFQTRILRVGVKYTFFRY